MKQSRKSNGQYSNKPRNIFTWRVGVLSATILWCAIAGSYSNEDNTYTVEKQIVATSTPVIKKVLTTEDKIKEYFPRSYKTMIAVAHAESSMNPNAVGYNCYYYKGKATNTPVKGGSKACKVEDRNFAWSYDCGLLQVNNGKKECPKETIEEHLQRAADLSRVQGLEAWVTYNTGAHEKHLVKN